MEISAGVLSSPSYLVLSLVFVFVKSYPYEYEYATNVRYYTRLIRLKQGDLKGIVVGSLNGSRVPDVEQYLGIPYAAPPVGMLRFMPPGSAPRWTNIKYADSFGPVCPQRLPNRKGMPIERQEYFQRIEQHLLNQSEDCLYLNIYAPVQDPDNLGNYPVMVYLHGGDFEWDAGSVYDGSVLAAYGKVIVVTLNFRLGIFGFFKTRLEGDTTMNFGLIDQIAALLWIQENIQQFGGNPNSVTVFGQGTGAVCANLLMMSPMVIKNGTKLLFHRAILMSGSALSDWALVKNPAQVTLQVARHTGCGSLGDELEKCLRKKRVQDLMNIDIETAEYEMRFGPIVDSAVIPSDPRNSMTRYNDIFKRFSMIYGVTEVESGHLLNDIAMGAGMLQEERDEELRKYFQAKYESNVDSILAYTISKYKENEKKYTPRESLYGKQYDPVSSTRDNLLDILSDARTVAPLLEMAKLHSALVDNSYFYVFGHETASSRYYRTKTFPGDELPYVFGVPIGGPKNHFQDSYTTEEKLLSEIIMTHFTNFAQTSDPNIPRIDDYYTGHPMEWKDWNVRWTSFDSYHEPYLYYDTPPKGPKMDFYYRSNEKNFWNKELPDLLKVRLPSFPYSYPKNVTLVPAPNPLGISPPPMRPIFMKTHSSNQESLPIKGTESEPENDEEINLPKPSMTEPGTDTTNTAKIVIAVGTVLLLLNVFILGFLYYKCFRLKKRIQRRRNDLNRVKIDDLLDIEPDETQPHVKRSYDCNFMRIITKSSKIEDTYEAVLKTEEGGESKFKLTRQMSSSTMDAHSKVRDWIAQGTRMCSPKILQRSKLADRSKPKAEQIKVDPPTVPAVLNSADSTSTLNRSPTRPVSPVEKLEVKTESKKVEHSKANTTPVHKASSNKSLSSNKSNPSNKTTHKHHHSSNKTPPPNRKTHHRVHLKKPEKVSVAVDATPSGRGSSVLRQPPVELLKSFEFSNSYEQSSNINEPNLRRSATLDDVNSYPRDSETLRRSSTSINLRIPENGWDQGESTIVKIEHHHSKSDPVEGTKRVPLRRLRSFEPEQDINVTSKDDIMEPLTPLTPEQQLLTIKRRNFPKVLPDYPNRRLSMPTSNQLFHSIPEKGMISSFSQPTSPNSLNGRFPPTPPPRTTSSLGRNTSRPPLNHSHAVLAEEPPEEPEPMMACNNLYVGPILPVKGIKKVHPSPNDSYKLNTQPIYGNLNPPKEASDSSHEKREPKVIITTDPDNPVKRVEPKIIIKPTTSRKPKELNRNKVIPRVQASMDHPPLRKQSSKEVLADEGVVEQNECKEVSNKVEDSADKGTKDVDNSSSDSSEVSDTGTVVKRE